jgi:hypothetical protein
MAIEKKILREDYVIRVRPTLDKKCKWDGVVEVSIITSPKNRMEDDDYYSVLHLCKLMCATVPIMETDDSLREDLTDYVENVVDKEYHDMIEGKDKKKPIVTTSIEDNIISLNFKKD